jgi:hypothetical protein
MLRRHMAGLDCALSEADFQQAVLMTEGWSGSDIEVYAVVLHDGDVAQQSVASVAEACIWCMSLTFNFLMHLYRSCAERQASIHKWTFDCQCCACSQLSVSSRSDGPYTRGAALPSVRK